ncbi:MAG: 4-hydroxy-tetrahydrodipicolinate reductase [Burkholderiales bacterium]
MARIRMAIAGSSGRMGRMLVQAVLRSADLQLVAALEQTGSPQIGKDAGELAGEAACGVKISADVKRSLAASDVLVDFTRPEGTLAHLAACRALGVGMVIGTTGFSAEQKNGIVEAARDIAIVLSPNMAVGVNVTFKLAQIAAAILGDEYDVEIIEAHHRHKVDAPSGTALKFGEIVAGALHRDLAQAAVYGRHGVTGERDARSIGFHAIRGGDIVGEHTVMFAGEGERVEVTVRSGSRMTYATGALRAARFLAGRKSGLFDMFDVLGLNSAAPS